MAHDKLKWVVQFLVLTLSLAFLGACGGGGGGGGGTTSPTPTVGKVTVSGQVTGSGGIADVAVSAGGISATTDSNGFYSLRHHSKLG